MAFDIHYGIYIKFSFAKKIHLQNAFNTLLKVSNMITSYRTVIQQMRKNVMFTVELTAHMGSITNK